MKISFILSWLVLTISLTTYAKVYNFQCAITEITELGRSQFNRKEEHVSTICDRGGCKTGNSVTISHPEEGIEYIFIGPYQFMPESATDTNSSTAERSTDGPRRLTSEYAHVYLVTHPSLEGKYAIAIYHPDGRGIGYVFRIDDKIENGEKLLTLDCRGGI